MDTDLYTYRELNEYGIVYQRFVLRKVPSNFDRDGKQYLMPDQFVSTIGEVLRLSRFFYEKCEYSGDIEITAQLRQIFGEELMLWQGQIRTSIKQQQSYDSEISASTQYLPRDLVKKEIFIKIVDELVGQLLWAFNVDDPTVRKKLVESIL